MIAFASWSYYTRERELEQIEVVFPEQILVALREQPQDFRKRVFIYTLGKLYEAGRISGGFGAMVLGCDRWEFYRLLSENGFGR